MQNIRIIPSVLYPERYAYELNQTYEPAGDRGRPFFHYLWRYETYGDGTTKHSHSSRPGWEDMIDLCLSVCAAVQADPHAPEWGVLIRELVDFRIQASALRFALSVSHVEGKRRFYSLSEQKISTSPAKRNDRRYTEIDAHHTGTPKSAFGVLFPFGGNRDWIVLLFVASDLIDQHDADGGGFVGGVASILPELEKLPGHWPCAYHALRRAIEGAAKLRTAKFSFDSAIADVEEKRRQEEEARALEEAGRAIEAGAPISGGAA